MATIARRGWRPQHTETYAFIAGLFWGFILGFGSAVLVAQALGLERHF